VVLQLHVADTEAVLAMMLDAGASVVFPTTELFGERMARVRDPFGHLWILRQRLVDLKPGEIQRLRDELFARVAQLEDTNTLEHPPAPRQAPRGRFHLVVGPVGAGKSTFAERLAREHGALRLTLDDWMTTLFGPDRPNEGVMDWYVERAARGIEQIWKLAQATAELGTSVILEIGLLRRAERESFYRRAAGASADLTIHVLDAARDVRRERVVARNRKKGATFSMVVPPAIFELASDLWEPLDQVECEGRDVRFLRTDVTGRAIDLRAEPDEKPRDTDPLPAPPADRPGRRS
jgi:predicted kinase